MWVSRGQTQIAKLVQQAPIPNEPLSLLADPLAIGKDMLTYFRGPFVSEATNSQTSCTDYCGGRPPQCSIISVYRHAKDCSVFLMILISLEA